MVLSKSIMVACVGKKINEDATCKAEESRDAGVDLGLAKTRIVVSPSDKKANL